MANNDLLIERKKIVSEIKAIEVAQGREAMKLDTTYIKLKGRLQDILKIEEASLESRKQSLDGINELRDSTASLSIIYKDIKKDVSSQHSIQTKLVESMAIQLERGGGISEINTIQHTQVEDILKAYEEQAKMAQELSQLSDEQSTQRGVLLEDLKGQIEVIQHHNNLLDGRTSIVKEFRSVQGDLETAVQNQIKSATELSSLSEKEKGILEEQVKAFAVIKEKVDAIGSSLTTWLRKPQVALGAIIGGVGTWINRIGDVNKELGFTLRDMNSTAMQAGLLSFAFEDTAGTVKALAKEFGSLESATLGAQINVGLMASTMGISNTEAVHLMGSFARLNGGSKNIASDMIATTKEFAKQNNVIPSDVLSDLADNSEAFALYAKDGGDNLIKAAVGARKLGTDLGTLTGIADTLLDFESSITSELELSAMLGRSINLSKARQLAYDGDIEGATRESLRQMGGIAAFSKMDYFQKRATAATLGITVVQLQSMADKQSRIGQSGEVIQEKFSKWGASLDVITNKYLGTGVQVLGGWVATSAEVGANFSRLGFSLGGIVKKTGSVLKNLAGMVTGPISKGLSAIGDKLGGGIGSKSISKTSKIPTSAGKGLTSFTSGIQKMNPAKLLAGAAALVIVAGAVFVFGKAVQEFMKVSWNAVGMAVVSMAALIGGVLLLGTIMSSGMIVPLLAGAAAMVIVAGSMWVLGKALQEIGSGFDILSNSIGPLLNVVSDSASIAGSIILLGFGLSSLAVGLTTLGLSTPFAMLAMIPLSKLSNMSGDLSQTSSALFGMGTALGLVASQLEKIDPSKLDSLREFSITTSIGTAITGIADSIGGLIDVVAGDSTEKSLSDYESQMLTKMDTLIKEVKSNRDIYLDKEKVTSVIKKTSERQTKNSFGLSVA